MGNPLVARIGTLICIAAAVAACHRSGPPASDTARHYETRGIVRGLAPDHRTIDVEHEDIRGFMPSMTMPLSAHDEKEVADLKLSDAISFRLNVTDEDVWIDHVRKIASGEVHLPVPTPPPIRSSKLTRLHEGDQMPPFNLTAQTGQPVSPETFHGQPFVLTFVFTRCPLPTFCPRMSQNFSELQKAIKAGGDGLRNTRLLSITLDPSYDTPEVLSKYAEYQKADPPIWTFATGDPVEIEKITGAFSVYVQPEGGTISHGLATALIGPDGRVVKIWRGNGWTPTEVLEQIRSANP